MPEIAIQVDGAEVIPFAIAPQLGFRLRVSSEPANQLVHAILLRAQIQIEVSRRKYNSEEQTSLRDLFGEPERWPDTLKTMLWSHAAVVVPHFSGATSVQMPVPCSFDFTVAATKYFSGLTDGAVPLCFQFSGTVFYDAPENGLQAAPISWDKEAKFQLPLKTWGELMDAYYPNVAWLALRKDVFEKLYEYKVSQGIPTWEQALEKILAEVGESIRS